MKLLSFTMPDDFNFYWFADQHEGTIFQVSHAIEELYKTILKDPIGYGACGGDWAESRKIDHPYYVHDHAKAGVKTPLMQLLKVRDELKPLADKKKLLWINKGNHESSVDSFGNLTEALCKELRVEYGTWTTKATFKRKNGRDMFKVFATHGFTKVHSLTSQAQDPKLQRAHRELKLKKMLYPLAGDCIAQLVAHYHTLVNSSPSKELYLTDDGKKIKQAYTEHTGNSYIHPDHRYYCCTGSFYRQYKPDFDSYSEMAGYRPTEIGYQILRVRDTKLVGIDPVIVGY